jgi:porin
MLQPSHPGTIMTIPTHRTGLRKIGSHDLRPLSPLAPASACLASFIVGLASPIFADGEESLWARETLTGDWFGARDSLAEHGLTTELSTTGYYAGVLSGGGRNDEGDFGGRADAFLHLNTDKAGWWQGGGFHLHAESRFGEAADRTAPRSGGLWPPNTGVALPLGDPDRLVASSIYYTHAFTPESVMMIGKINAVDLLASDPFFGGWARDRFENIAFVAPPSGVVPPTIMGAIFNQKLDAITITAMVFDPNDRTNDYWVDELFEDGVNLSLGGTWKGKLLDRASSIGLTATYSTKEGADLSEILLPPDVKGGGKEGSFNIALSGSHLLYELPDQKGKGFGIYGKAAIADGNPNPIQSSFVGGFAGYGMVPGRPDDHFGIGYYFYDWSNDLQSATAGAFTIRDEHGVELFYNLAITPWCRVSADLQWINPANATFSDAWIGGLRATLFF